MMRLTTHNAPTGTSRAHRTDVEVLSRALSRLKVRARQVEPEGWWLQASELTSLGYVHLVLDMAQRLRSLGMGPGSRILDWGAGPGFLTYLLQEAGFAATYYDLDYQYPSYHLVLSLLDGDKQFVEDPVALPFQDGSFDAAVSFGVLEHVPDPQASLGELRRVLRAGGLLFVYHYPNRSSYIEAAARALDKPHHEARLSKRALARLLSTSGFQVDSIWYRYLLPRNLTDMSRLRHVIDGHAEGAYRLDQTLTRVPGLRVVSTTLNAVAVNPVDQ